MNEISWFPNETSWLNAEPPSETHIIGSISLPSHRTSRSHKQYRNSCPPMHATLKFFQIRNAAFDRTETFQAIPGYCILWKKNLFSAQSSPRTQMWKLRALCQRNPAWRLHRPTKNNDISDINDQLLLKLILFTAFNAWSQPAHKTSQKSASKSCNVKLTDPTPK